MIKNPFKPLLSKLLSKNFDTYAKISNFTVTI